MKGLRKKVLKLEYEKALLFLNKKPFLTIEDSQKEISSKNNPLEQANYRILLLRNAPIDESQIKGGVALSPVELIKDDSKLTARVLGKCVKKNILKKLVHADCKYIYWVKPEAQSLKEQLLHLNMLKAYIRAEPKEAFLGCLLESRLETKSTVTKGLNSSNYKYYYPSQILNLCEIIDHLGGTTTSTGLEIVGQLLQTIETSISSVSMLLALKKESLSPTAEGQQSDVNNSTN